MRALTADKAVVSEIRYATVPELSFFGDEFLSYVVEPDETKSASDWLFEFDQGDWESARVEKVGYSLSRQLELPRIRSVVIATSIGPIMLLLARYQSFISNVGKIHK